jgi:hypothetical protein
MGRPPVGGMADMRDFRRRRLLIGLVVLLIVAGAVIAVMLAGGSSSDKGAAAAEGPPFDGTVYVESNSPDSGANSVLAFRYRAGSFRPLSVREYATGGSGSNDLANRGVLDAEQQMVTNADKTLLFAVNAGSDTVAVFHISDDGTLTPVKGSPFPSRGKGPASVGVSGDTLFVANKAHDGIRDLTKEAPNYVSFKIGPDGALTPIGQPVDAPPKSSPTEAYVPPGSGLMVGTEEEGPWRVFKVDGSGAITQVPDSPHPLEPEVFAPDKPHPQVWAQGIVKHPKLPLLYAGVANVRKLVVYSYDADGRLTLVDQQLDKGAFLPCWTQISADGTRLYTGNAGSQNISVYDIGSDPRHPRQIQRVTLNGKGNPWSFQIDPSGRYIFMVNMRAIRAIPPGAGNTLHSFRIEPDGKLTEMTSSPVPIPVKLGTNPWGIAVVPRR